MREILFRGFHPNDAGEQIAIVNGKEHRGTWVYGNLLVDEGGNCYIGTYLKSSRCDSFIAGGGRQAGKTFKRFIGIGFVFVLPETIGEYTGLTDKNGKKIFEGDVVYDSIDEENALLVWGNGSYYLKNEYMHLILGESVANQIEVIGNIHDNKEILDVK